MVPGVEIVDVSPIRHNKTVPIEFLLDPTGQQFLVGMGRNTIDGGGVDHGGQSTGLETLFERAEIFLPQIIISNICRCAVFAGVRDSIAYEVLDADSGMLKVDMVRVISLDRHDFGAGHLGLEIGILPPALPMPWPAGITTEIHDRGENPTNLSRPGLVSESLTHHSGIFPVESRSQIDFLRIEGTIGKV